MDTKAHCISLSAELHAVKNRVQNLIGENHWPTVGSWKESALRAVIRRYLPSQLHIGTGFVMTDGGLSTQIDVLIYDNSGPILFQDGDLVIVTPDVIRAIIEVKTRIDRRGLKECLSKLNGNVQLVTSTPSNYAPMFFGLFAYEGLGLKPDFLLRTLKDVNGGRNGCVINCVCIGDKQFVRYWQHPPMPPRRDYAHWHCYKLDNVAQAYFVHNVIDHLFPNPVFSNNSLWYPEEGKETYVVGKISRRLGN